ncbi:zinc finger protein 862 [Lingula anatina]|uniref:Zinc finger protein 862 n=1 Tax=Lingula anatina TaxID=7574 RepID=A0A1S3H0Q8_LINAN|nr:zinc finger protein 862 [Lingula anatina]|eukprot:XP_013379578.1 zinc finger protein 862 [Lingula anatina]
MTCTVCIEHEEALKGQCAIQSRVFIDGCNSMKSESISLHENAQAHRLALSIDSRKLQPEMSPATLACQALNKAHMEKLRLLFRNTHALAKNRKSFLDYKWLCDLDEVKGLEPGKTYHNETACRTFTKSIASTTKQQLADVINNRSFISITSDGSTDSSRTEQEIVFVRFAEKGTVHTVFAGIVSPKSPDAIWIYNAILKGLEGMGITQDTLGEKLAGLGCDGASVMTGRVGGVAAFFRDLQPSATVIHCLAHRLELSCKEHQAL